MKRKPQRPAGAAAEPDNESPVAPEILSAAKRSLTSDRPAVFAFATEPGKRVEKCSVCGGEATHTAGDPLCWVCRRLKISAWREVEQQAPAQE